MTYIVMNDDYTKVELITTRLSLVKEFLDANTSEYYRVLVELEDLSTE